MSLNPKSAKSRARCGPGELLAGKENVIEAIFDALREIEPFLNDTAEEGQKWILLLTLLTKIF